MTDDIITAPDSTELEVTTPAFGRSLLGYRRSDVDAAVLELTQRAAGVDRHNAALRAQLTTTEHVLSETKHDLTRARAELRYWNDRASYIDGEVARARRRALEIEQEARERSEAIEADAQERSMQLIDRVCSEANALLQTAREEARDMFLRFEQDVDLSQQRLVRLEDVRADVAQSMQAALIQFEAAVRELDHAGPIHRVNAALAEPQRRALPTFGRERAIEAARRFDESHGERAHETVTGALELEAIEWTEDAPAPHASYPAPSSNDSMTLSSITPPPMSDDVVRERRTHPADAEFEALLSE
jgi:hypothetical protein